MAFICHHRQITITQNCSSSTLPAEIPSACAHSASVVELHTSVFMKAEEYMDVVAFQKIWWDSEQQQQILIIVTAESTNAQIIHANIHTWAFSYISHNVLVIKKRLSATCGDDGENYKILKRSMYVCSQHFKSDYSKATECKTPKHEPLPSQS